MCRAAARTRASRPRSPRCRLGGYVTLPRLLDKGRATIAGTNGEFNYDAPIDQHLKDFLGVDTAALREQLASGKGDGEILAWIKANQRHRHTDAEIAQWSRFQDERVSGDLDSREYFHSEHKRIAPQREDLCAWADLLDLDDYVSFGGKA